MSPPVTRCAARTRARPGQGSHPTGSEMAASITTVFTLADGKPEKGWTNADSLGLM